MLKRPRLSHLEMLALLWCEVCRDITEHWKTNGRESIWRYCCEQCKVVRKADIDKGVFKGLRIEKDRKAVNHNRETAKEQKK